jgi:outer membrane protein OmpA-like peptidoglycan-associated protein
VEVSTTSQASGFTPVLEASLAPKADGQRFEAQALSPARWVRLSILSNHGSEEWTELLSFKGFGKRPPLQVTPSAVSGTFDTDYFEFHVLQTGSALTGCYEYNYGILDGTIEGRVMKITWQEGEEGQLKGPAVMVFAPDGQSFRGYFWREGNEKEPPAGTWNGEKASSDVGQCPHWTRTLGGELKRGLADAGRVRLYGILFDVDSEVIRPESMPVLDEVVALLRDEPSWTLTIEGHTDSTGSESHNQILSESRAAAIEEYLVASGIDGGRLMTAGFGETSPVADNATELGRAQNRRVELVRGSPPGS